MLKEGMQFLPYPAVMLKIANHHGKEKGVATNTIAYHEPGPLLNYSTLYLSPAILRHDSVGVLIL